MAERSRRTLKFISTRCYFRIDVSVLFSLAAILILGCSKFSTNPTSQVLNSKQPSNVPPSPSAEILNQTKICNGQVNTGANPVKRLTRLELQNTLTDLLKEFLSSQQLSEALALLPEENEKDEGVLFDTFDQGITRNHIAGYSQTAEKLAGYLKSSPSFLQKYLGGDCPKDGRLGLPCLDQLLNSFGFLVYRKPVPQDDVDMLRKFVSAHQGKANVLESILTFFFNSPEFLYRVESYETLTSLSHDKNLYAVNDYQLASRLSYSMWATMPDKTLFDLARSGRLVLTSELISQVARMMQDPRAKGQMQRFYLQWLHKEHLDTSGHPDWFAAGVNTATVAEDLKKDLLNYVDHTTYTKKGNFNDLMTSDETVISSENAAKIYGVNFSGSPSVMRLGPNRKGLLTRAAIAYSSNQEPSYVHVGVLLRTNILCQPMPKPNEALLAGANQDPIEVNAGASSRDQIHSRTSSGVCYSCHAKINPFAYIMLNFDALGRFQDMETVYDSEGRVLGRHPVNAIVSPFIDTATEPEVNGASEMSVAIAKSQAGPACFANRYFQFVSGKAADQNDRCQVEQPVKTLVNNSIIEMAEQFYLHPSFRLKRVVAQ